MTSTVFSHTQQEIQIVVHRKSAKASSKNISDIFEKTHKNVLRVVDRIMAETSNDFHKLNFEPVETIKKNSMGREYVEREVFMTRDGFSLVMMSLTGARAMEKKIAYINAFNAMEKALMSNGATEQERRESRACFTQPFSIPAACLPTSTVL
jgi:Rha family phage regulatory protein